MTSALGAVYWVSCLTQSVPVGHAGVSRTSTVNVVLSSLVTRSLVWGPALRGRLLGVVLRKIGPEFMRMLTLSPAQLPELEAATASAPICVSVFLGGVAAPSPLGAAAAAAEGGAAAGSAAGSAEVLASALAGGHKSAMI